MRLAPILLLLAAMAAPALAQDWQEPPALAGQVADGGLPPVSERIPDEPLIYDPRAHGGEIGSYGGTLRLIEGQAKDTRRMVVYGYARLVGYTPEGTLAPDIAKAVEVEDGRIFTFHLRAGHRWSDGAPFTADDFRYYWEDIANNAELAPYGPPRELLVDGKPPHVTFPDATTVRYEWDSPNPYFLPALAGAQPLYIFRPAHYLKQFHARYADPAALERAVAQAGQRNWVALHFKFDQAYKNSNPDMPSLEPWVLRTAPPSDRFIFARNPFFHRVDPEGHQLPYIDEVAMSIAAPRLIPAKTGAGEADLQASYLGLANFAFLNRAEKVEDFEVRRWQSGRGSRLVLFPNLNAQDETWAQLFRQADFRRALSLAINREDINKAIYYGLGRPGIDTVEPQSPLYDARTANLYAGYDPAYAERLLDGLGLVERGPGGVRLLPDGRPMIIVVETAGEDTEQVDVLELVAEDLARIGITLITRTGERETMERRISAGLTLMSVWTGLENALPNAGSDPAELAPTNSRQPEWPAWGAWYETKGSSGAEPDMPAARQLLALNAEWSETNDEARKAEIWRQMLRINADEALRIGIVSNIDQIVVVSDRLKNVPQRGIYNWNPGAFFGMYRPDSFFLTRQEHVAEGRS
ncbi:ABC transporter substrate-binding protein [Aureimonas altamirensis]|uniref:ABC transporter substrate-binding protein n=1 Tax=Aureimonas altamirensis TaxID=370622 RepID=UPI002036B1D5|nr:ABC transporter substrate-binding protein [Aureimonas altamirensis]MCM2502751.1 ABC transporter substrate-binding protein [Aureimonas altamirensis]